MKSNLANKVTQAEEIKNSLNGLDWEMSIRAFFEHLGTSPNDFYLDENAILPIQENIKEYVEDKIELNWEDFVSSLEAVLIKDKFGFPENNRDKLLDKYNKAKDKLGRTPKNLEEIYEVLSKLNFEEKEKLMLEELQEFKNSSEMLELEKKALEDEIKALSKEFEKNQERFDEDLIKKEIEFDEAVAKNDVEWQAKLDKEIKELKKAEFKKFNQLKEQLTARNEKLSKLIKDLETKSNSKIRALNVKLTKLHEQATKIKKAYDQRTNALGKSNKEKKELQSSLTNVSKDLETLKANFALKEMELKEAQETITSLNNFIETSNIEEIQKLYENFEKLKENVAKLKNQNKIILQSYQNLLASNRELRNLSVKGTNVIKKQTKKIKELKGTKTKKSFFHKVGVFVTLSGSIGVVSAAVYYLSIMV